MFAPLRNERAFESIVRQIKEAIYSEKLKPGDKLPTERDLAGRFNVSRAAVRSAVLNLEQAGFLKIKKGAGGGFFIREMGFKPVRDSLNDLLKLGKASISDLTEVRLSLEPQAAKLAARRANQDDLTKIEDVILGFKQRIPQGSPPSPDDFNFHVYVAEASKNPIIIIFMRSLMDLLFQSFGSYVLDKGKSEEIVDQHERILDAIKAEDEENAQAFALEHVKAMRSLFKKYEIDSN